MMNGWHGLHIGFGVIGTLLASYSLYLVSQNKIHLGTLLPLFIGVGFVGCGLFYRHFANLPPLWAKLWQVFLLGFWCWVLTVFVFFGFLAWHNSKVTNVQTTPLAIIILGSKASNGVPSPALASRLDSAAQLSAKYPNAWLVTTGGIGFGERISEAAAASDYLQRQYSIDPSRILVEDKSTSTELNLVNTKPILQNQNITTTDPMVIVTSDFHTIRTQKIAKKQGYTNITVMPAPTPLQTRYHSWLREYFAFVSGYVLGEF